MLALDPKISSHWTLSMIAAHSNFLLAGIARAFAAAEEAQKN